MTEPPPVDPPQAVESEVSTIRPRVSKLAIASLACAFLPVPVLGAFLAIVFAIKARRRIERSQGALTGRGLADAGFLCGIISGGLSMIVGLDVAALSVTAKKGPRSATVANAKSIGLALFKFEQEFGCFPSPATIRRVERANQDCSLPLGTHYSNDYFRQLIAAGHADSERVFYALAPYTRKPDNNLTGERCLAAGEVGFAYIMASENEPVPSVGNSGRPLVMAAVDNGATDGTCDPKVYDGRAVVLRVDQSVTDLPVRPTDKKVLVGGGRTLLEGDSDETVWGIGMKPILKAPKMIKGN
jgi:Domain of unknown function (DUF4190)